MRFAASLIVIAVGAILAFGVTASPGAVDIQMIGLILIIVGLAGLAIARWLFLTRRRTDIIYRRDGQTLLEPTSAPPAGFREPVERPVLGLPRQRYIPTLRVPERFAERPAYDNRSERVEHGVMDVEPGSAEFRRQGLLDD